jgi:hypothetical protein
MKPDGQLGENASSFVSFAKKSAAILCQGVDFAFLSGVQGGTPTQPSLRSEVSLLQGDLGRSKHWFTNTLLGSWIK